MKPAVEHLRIGSEKLALHGWIPSRASAVVFYIHGLQSHAGWLFETGPSLCGRGVAVYALDRRGCGLSEGSRGHVDSFKTWIDDYTQAINQVRDRHPASPMTLLGQSMGGSLLAGVVSANAARYDSLIFVAPGINQSPKTPEAAAQIGRLRSSVAKNRENGLALIPVPLKDEWYTSLDEFLSFMKGDSLMAREITVQARLAGADLRDFYMSRPSAWRKAPTVLVLPKKDKIIDLDAARQALAKLAGKDLFCFEIPVEDHYIEFSEQRESYASFIASCALSAGFSK